MPKLENPLSKQEAAVAQIMGVQFFDSIEEQERAYLLEGMHRSGEERFQFATLLKREGRAIRTAAPLMAPKIVPWHSHFIAFWKQLNHFGVEYILIGDVAMYLQGYSHFEALMELYLFDSPANRKRLRQTIKAHNDLDLSLVETMPFASGLIHLPLSAGLQLRIATSLKGIEASFAECFAMADKHFVQGISVPVLHLDHLIVNKKAVARPKDLLAVMQLEKVKRLREEKLLLNPA